MPSKPGLHVPGGVYHVILRGNNRRNLFFSAADRAHLHQLVAPGANVPEQTFRTFLTLPADASAL